MPRRLAPARTARGRVPDGCPLSAREYQILCLATVGLSKVETARVLGITPSTVRSVLKNARHRMDVDTLEQLVAEATARGWLLHEPPQRGLTVVQRRYLHQFDRMLRGEPADTDECFRAMCVERGVTDPRGRSYRRPDATRLGEVSEALDRFLEEVFDA